MLQIIKLFKIKFPTIPHFQNFFTTKIDENQFWADFQGNRLVYQAWNKRNKMNIRDYNPRVNTINQRLSL